MLLAMLDINWQWPCPALLLHAPAESHSMLHNRGYHTWSHSTDSGRREELNALAPSFSYTTVLPRYPLTFSQADILHVPFTKDGKLPGLP